MRSAGLAAILALFSWGVSPLAQIAYTSNIGGSWDLYLWDGQETRQLTRDPASDFYPSWAPDGRRLVFFSKRDGNDEIYLLDVQTLETKRLTHHPAVDKAPRWSPDGRWIAFSSNRDGDFEIYRMRPDGSDPVRLTHSPGEDLVPAWSPDGKWIAFASARGGNLDIYVMRWDGQEVRQLTHHPSFDSYPDWSPDGEHILFASMRDGDFEIYEMDREGRNLVQLTHNEVDDAFPRWSPDGLQIAYQWESPRGNWVVCLMSRDSGERRCITPDTGWSAEPAWYPRGTVSVSTPGTRPVLWGNLRKGGEIAEQAPMQETRREK